MSRDDLLQVNYKIMQQVTEQVVKYCPNAIIVPVANSTRCDVPGGLSLERLSRERVIGMAGVLDSARMRAFIATRAQRVRGEHPRVCPRRSRRHDGAAARYSTVAGIPITELLSKERIDAICKRTADGGAEITKLVGTSAWYAPGPQRRKWSRSS
jgi:malate dehydrogenase